VPPSMSAQGQTRLSAVMPRMSAKRPKANNQHPVSKVAEMPEAVIRRDNRVSRTSPRRNAVLHAGPSTILIDSE
jgi:hypothetical protein